MWITNYIERTPYLSADEMTADYKANPENYYGMLKAIDEEEFDYINQSLLALSTDKTSWTEKSHRKI